MKKPKIIIFVNGGVVQDVVLIPKKKKLNILVELRDYDTDHSDEVEAHHPNYRRDSQGNIYFKGLYSL